MVGLGIISLFSKTTLQELGIIPIGKYEFGMLHPPYMIFSHSYVRLFHMQLPYLKWILREGLGL